MKTTFFKNKFFYLTIGSVSTIGSFVYFGESILLKYAILLRNSFKSKQSNDDNQYIYLSDDLVDDTSDDFSFNGINPKTNSNFNRRHWHLLSLAKCKRDYNIRQFAIETIAKTQLNEYESRQIAQSCDFETSVALARIPSVSLKLFLLPIKTDFIKLSPKTRFHLNKTSTPYFNFEEVLLNLLRETDIYENQCSECTKYFTQLAIKIMETQISSKEIHQLSDCNDIYAHNRNYASKVNWVCLQAIMENILCGKNQCLKLVNNGLFLILLHLREKFSDMKVQTWIAQTLANLSIYKETHLHFWYTGWIGVLAQWLQSNQLELSLSAAKILHNLSQKSEDNLLSESMYLLHPIFHESVNKDFDVIFVHGLLGGAFKTWRQCDSEKNLQTYTRCWPQQWLADDIQNIRILAVNYQTFLSNWNIQCQDNIFTLKERSYQLLKELILSKVGQKPIIWVTHSMGGLLVKQILNDINESSDSKLKNILDHTKGIVFYSVPHKGSEMAIWSPRIQRIISPSSEVLELRKDSDSLLSLHENFVKLIEKKRIQCLSFGEMLESTVVSKPFKLKYLLVPEDSSDPGIGRFHLLPVDHFNTCKPKCKSSEAYLIVSDFIKDLIETHNENDDYKCDKIEILLSSIFS